MDRQRALTMQQNEAFFRRLAELDLRVFVKLFGIKSERGEKLNFRDHLFLVDPLTDWNPYQVCMKSAQCGWSTLAILKTLWAAKNKKFSIAYTLPTSSDAQEFVRTKVNRIIQANPILQSYVIEGNNIGDKRVGDSNVFFRGSFLERAAISFTADLVCFDEVDRSDSSVLSTYSSRLQHSNYKGEWSFSNPSVAGNGVSRLWAESDQKHWFVTCGTCKEKQYLSWPDSICRERRVYQCKVCHAPLSDEMRRTGSWVQRLQGRKYSGYWVSSLMAPWLSAEYIIEQYQTKSLDFFFNFVLGLPYVGEGNTVTPEMIFRNCTGEINSQESVVIGCDSGIRKHYVLGNKEGLFFHGMTETWETIEGFLHKYPKSVAVIDALPDLTEPRKLREKYPGRVFLCYFARDRKTMQFCRFGEGPESGNVVVDRNRMLQLMIDEFADGRVPLQGTRDDWSEFYSHFRVLYRMENKDAQGNPFFVWESSSSEDHWAFATLYWRVGMSRFSGVESSVIVPSERKRTIWQEEDVGLLPAKAPAPADVFRLSRKRDWRV